MPKDTFSSQTLHKFLCSLEMATWKSFGHLALFKWNDSVTRGKVVFCCNANC